MENNASSGLYDQALKAYQAGQEDQAARLLEQAAELGNCKAQQNLGYRYYKGDGVPQDLEKALKWFGQAAAQGDPTAQFQCCQMHQKGEGTLIDYEKALYWCGKAAENGYNGAEGEYAFLKMTMMSHDAAEMGERNRILDRYAKAVGRECLLESDVICAQEWFEEAARRGGADNQFCCGLLYYKDNAQKGNTEKAYFWFQEAARQNHARAQLYCGKLCYYDLFDRAQGKQWLEKVTHHSGDKEARMEALGILFDEPFLRFSLTSLTVCT